MITATFNGTVIAEAESTVVVEGNHYFPPNSLRREHLADSRTRSLCPWKGIARYHDVVVDGVELSDAAWYYPRPTPFARRIRGHVAFWNGVEVQER